MKKIHITVFILISIHLYSLHFQKHVIGFSKNNHSIQAYCFGRGKQTLVLIAGFRKNDEVLSQGLYDLVEQIKNKKIAVPDHKRLIIIPRIKSAALPDDVPADLKDVDLNCNFATSNWKNHYYFYSKAVFCGLKPLSEVETVAIKNYFENLKDLDQKSVIVSFYRGNDTILFEDDHNFNTNLTSSMVEAVGFSINTQQASKAGSFNLWINENFKAANVSVYMDLNARHNMEKILTHLLKLNFNKSIYHPAAGLDQMLEKGKEDLIKKLPQPVRALVVKSRDNRDEFFKLYVLIQKDEELLLLVNKTHLLDTDYVPADLVLIKDTFITNKEYGQLRKILFNDLSDFFKAAGQNKMKLSIISAYRSYATQEKVFAKWEKVLGNREAARVSAKPGASQHQLGTAIDFNMLDEKFGETREGVWLYENAHQYGFILSYPRGMESHTGYKYEPWHFRYIGKEAALLVYKYFNQDLELFLNWYWDNRLD